MRDASFFLHPQIEWQRRYEALRACLVERLPAKVVAERFGYTEGYVRFLKYQFRHGKLDFGDPTIEPAARRRRVTAETRRNIRGWRQQRYSAAEISELLAREGILLSARTVERVLAEEGFPKLPRRRKLWPGHLTASNEPPAQPQVLRIGDLEGLQQSSPCAGLFLFAPLLGQLDLDELVRGARLPDAQGIPARSYLLSLLAWKLLGHGARSSLNGQAASQIMGLFAGLNVLPDRSALSRYVSSLDQDHLTRLQQGLFRQATRLGLHGGQVVRIDLHAIPTGDPILEPPPPARIGRQHVASYLAVRNVASMRMLYTATSTGNHDHAEQLRRFCDFWQSVRGGPPPTLHVGAQFLSYTELAELDAHGILFVAPRRRGKRLLERATAEIGWQRLLIPAVQHAFVAPLVHESVVTLRGYRGRLRQLIVRGSGGELPLFLLSNDFTTPVEKLVGSVARSLQKERGVAASIEFFHPAQAPSPARVDVRFDVVLTMLADTLYTMLAGQLRGFEELEAPRLWRYFVQGGGIVEVRQGVVRVACPRGDRAPVLRAVPWQLLSRRLPGADGMRLDLHFE